MSGKMLNDYGIRLKKSLGQNFLRSADITDKIASSVENISELTIVEIGAGAGILTKSLCRRAHKVISYEIDKSLEELLNELMKENDNLEVRMKDFLDEDMSVFDSNERYAVCANLPYYITTPLLFKLFNSSVNFESITVMVQKEMGERFLAGKNDPKYNDLSVIAHYLYDVKKVMNVSKEEFMPVPKVDSMVISFHGKKEKQVENEEKFFEFVQGIFLYRRKTLLNNLGIYFKDKEKARLCLNKAGVADNKRAQELSLEEIIELYKESLC